VSEIDWQAALEVRGDTTKVFNKDGFNLGLNDQFKRSGIAFGDHGVTVNAFDWKGLGTDVGNTKSFASFIIESLPPLMSPLLTCQRHVGRPPRRRRGPGW